MNTSSLEHQSSKRKVLVVDDHPVMREGLGELIKREHDLELCCEAATIQQAMQTISDCMPDVVIVDLALGNSSGIRLIENIAYSYKNLLVLVYSMHDENLYAERCIKSGARGYIMKQEPTGNFLVALRTVLDGKVYVSDSLSEKLLHNLTSGKNGLHESPLELLGNRELEVYQLVGQGMKKREIAENLSISLKTVENHVEHIKRKMNFKDFHELLRHAFQNASEIIN